MLNAEQFRVLAEGALVTVQVPALAVAWGTVAAILLGIGSLSPVAPLRWLVRVYVEVVRGVSAIILLVWLYFALPLFGPELSSLQAGVLALGLNLSAYGAELVRGALQALPKGQTEAGIAINLSGRQRMWSIVLPQAMVTMLPPYGNLVIEVMKASSLVYLVSLRDITQRAQNMRQLREADTIDIFAAALVLYFVISLAITGITRLLERHYGRGLDTGRMAKAVK